MPTLQIETLALRQGNFTLDISGWEAPPAQVVLLAGPNGAGKTTMMEAALALRPAGERSVRLDGLDPASDRTRVAFVPTDLGFFPSARPEHLADFYRTLYPDFQRERFQAAAAAWKVPFGRALKTLSAGEKRRLYLALALATGAKALVLDEQLATLDPDLAYRLVDDLRSLAEKERLLLWVSTNVLEPFWGRFGRLDLLKDGSLERTLSPEDCEGRTPRQIWQEVFP